MKLDSSTFPRVIGKCYLFSWRQTNVHAQFCTSNIYVLSSCRVLSVIDRKDQIHLGLPLKSNCLGYVLGAGFIV